MKFIISLLLEFNCCLARYIGPIYQKKKFLNKHCSVKGKGAFSI